MLMVATPPARFARTWRLPLRPLPLRPLPLYTPASRALLAATAARKWPRPVPPLMVAPPPPLMVRKAGVAAVVAAGGARGGEEQVVVHLQLFPRGRVHHVVFRTPAWWRPRPGKL